LLGWFELFLARKGTIKKSAQNASDTYLFLYLRGWLTSFRKEPENNKIWMNISPFRWFKIRLAALVLLLSVLTTLGGVFYYRHEKLHTQTEKHNELRTISQLKSEQIRQWHRERMSEARFFSSSEPYVTFVRAILHGGSQEQEYLRSALSRIMTDNRYENIFLLDWEGKVVFSVLPQPVVFDSATISVSRQAIDEERIITRDLFMCPVHKKPHMQFVAPVLGPEHPIASLIFMVAPEDFLYPLIQEWPTPSLSAETVILRREADSVRILNPLRRLENASLRTTIHLTRTDIPAVQAALGYRGLFTGKDYSGEEVLSDIQEIPDTDWLIVVKVDTRELFRALHKHAVLIFIINILIIVIAGAILGWLYSGRQKRLYKELLRKRSELHRSREQFSAILYSIGDGVITTDLDGRVQQMNPVAEQLTGWNEREARELPIEDIFAVVNETTGEAVEHPVRKVLSSGKIVGLSNHTLLISRDGRRTPIADSGAPIRDEDDHITGVVMVFSDQTEQRARENQLRESQETIRLLFDSTAEGIYGIDLKGACIFCNQSALTMLGYDSEDEVLGHNMHDLIHHSFANHQPMDQQECKIFLAFRRGQGTHASDEVLWRRDGSCFPAEYWSYPIVRDQKITGAVITFLDISQRRHDEKVQQILQEIARTSGTTRAIEELLVVVREQLGMVMDFTNFYVALHEPGNNLLRKLIFVNEKFDMEQWGLDDSLSGYVVRTGKRLLIKRPDREAFASAHNMSLKGVPAECWLGVPLMIEDRVSGAMVVQSYRNPDAYNERTAQLLEMVAHELSVVLQRKEMIQSLIEAKERAEESDRLKTAFLANVSHEIRTPMNSILGFLDMLREPELSEEKKATYLDIVQLSGQRLLHTINDIIEISRIETGSIEIRQEEMDLSEVLRFYLEFFQPEATQKGLRLALEQQVTGEEALILSDRGKWDGILTNLIKNALKFTSQGSIELGSFLKEGMITVYVRDSGQGIPEHLRETIFERFVQANMQMNRAHEGSGLGLSISRAYARAMGGDIRVTSEEHKGSTFFVSIPHNPVHATETLKPEAIPSSRQSEPAQHKEPSPATDSVPVAVTNNTYDMQTSASLPQKTEEHPEMTILVAEDDEPSFEYLSAVLSFDHIRIVRTDNGADAVRLAREHPEISLILMDIKMPDMDGFEATRLIREFLPNIPIIAHTAYAMAAEINRALAAGCNEVLTKPIRREELLRIIHKYTPS